MFTQLIGVDFTSAPTRRKPVTAARGLLQGTMLKLQRLDALPTLAGFEALLTERTAARAGKGGHGKRGGRGGAF